MDEYCVKEKRWRSVEMKLSSNKSGFGTIVKNGMNPKNCLKVSIFRLDDLYIIGGNDGTSILNVAEIYQLKEKRIKKLKSMNHARDELAIAIGTDQKLYAIGGFGGPKK